MRIQTGGNLDVLSKTDNMSDMKQITAREFQKRFGQVAKGLAEGQAVEITNHGKPVGVFTKLARRSVVTPDFSANLKTTGCDPRLGDEILEEFNASLS